MFLPPGGAWPAGLHCVVGWETVSYLPVWGGIGRQSETEVTAQGPQSLE